MRPMSKERDIDDILDSLNQLLREGESHNDDHVEEDISAEEIEAKLHELDEEIDKLESEPLQPEETEETVDETTSESDTDSESGPESESDSESIREQNENDATVDPDEPSDEEEDEEPAGSPISIQRVVLTEEMLVNNPQGNLLSTALDRSSSSTEADRVDVESATGGETVSEEQAGEVSHTLLHIDHHHLEQLLEQVADDVIRQLQHELPILIKRSLHHHLVQMRDAGQPETDNDGNSEE
jgi:hypothetical protein